MSNMEQSNRQNSQVDDDDMRPEYDFSKGLSGVHASRFSKLSSDEALILGYWQGKGFDVASFSKREMRDIRTPDFRLSRSGKEVAFCEVKSFQKDTWLDDQLRHAAPGQLVGGLRTDPIANRISNAIHTAFKQFESVNAGHRLFNLLVLVNHDASAVPVDLDSVITGRYDPLHGILDATHTQYSGGRIRREKLEIDLYIWMDMPKSHRPRVRRLFFGNPGTQKQICDLLQLDPKEIKLITPAA